MLVPRSNTVLSGSPQKGSGQVGLLVLSLCLLAAVIFSSSASAAPVTGASLPGLEKALMAVEGARDGTLSSQSGFIAVGKQSLPPETADKLVGQACAARLRDIFAYSDSRPDSSAEDYCAFRACPSPGWSSPAPCFYTNGAGPGASPGFMPRC